MKKYILLLMALLPVTVFGQRITVNGGVTDAANKEPVIGASIVIQGTYTGTSADVGGRFTLNNVDPDAVLVVSALGYETAVVNVGGRTTINIELEADTKIIDDVVVIGYGVVRKSDLTSSISTVKGDDISSQSAGNALYALQGKTSGVQITGRGGPGETPRVIIRGVSTINKTDPLYVVDGTPLGTSINFLNPDDNESMEVLKDASAAAIYGTRGSNGVILITTKKGREGKTTFQLNSSVGFQTLQKPDIASASVYEKVYKARYENDGTSAVWRVQDNFPDSEGTDWWDQTIKPAAFHQNHTLSFQGGNDKIVYSGSLGYFKQDSQYDYGYWDRLTARFNTEYRFSKMVKFGLDLMPRWESWDDTPNFFSNAMAMDPTTPVFKAKDEWGTNPYNNYARAIHNQTWNPVADVARRNKHTDEYGLLANPYISFEPVKGLVLRTQFGVNGRFSIADEFKPVFFIDNLEKNDIAKAEREMKGIVDWSWTNTANYMKTFKEKHNRNVMAGYTMEKFGTYNIKGSREGIPSNYPDLQYVDAGTSNPQAEGTNKYVTLMSYLGRVMYNYDYRYYITASVRVDGSSKFPAGNKFATFPALSAAWRISEESFMENQNIFDDLKLRAGWGRVGNQEIASDAYLNLIGSGDYVLGGIRNVGTSISMVGNSTLRWETIEDYTVGVDMAFLGNRLSVTLEWFTKKSTDMLMERENMLVLGYPMWNGRMWANVGSIKASGWEFSANWRDSAGEFNYEIGLNLTAVKNKVLKLADNSPILTKTFGNSYVIRNEAGGELNRFYGFVVDGVFQNWTEVLNYTNDKGELLQPDAQPGDFRYKDTNGDGKFDDNDKKYIGNAFPKLSMGLNMKFGYKDFDLVANFYGTFGNDIYNAAKAGFYSGNGGQNVYADAWEKAWKGEGTSTTHPRLSVADKNMNYSRVSSFFVEDGSYFRCKVLQLGYTLPKKLMGNVGLRLYVSTENLFTFTKYSGMDPERGALGDPDKPLETGIDEIAYPSPRTFLFGINLTF